MLWNPAYKGMGARFNEAKNAAPAVGMNVRSLEVRDLREMEAAFDAVPRDPPDGLLLLADPLTISMRSAHRRVRPREEPAGDLRDARVRRGRRPHVLRAELERA